MEFKKIETQEQFDEAIKDRLAREAKKYEGYMSPEDVAKLNDDFSKKIEELNNQIKRYETNSVKMRICLNNGLPFEMASRLTGTTEEEIQKDAEQLAKLMSVNIKGSLNVAPQASTTKSSAEDGVTKI